MNYDLTRAGKHFRLVGLVIASTAILTTSALATGKICEPRTVVVGQQTTDVEVKKTKLIGDNGGSGSVFHGNPNCLWDGTCVPSDFPSLSTTGTAFEVEVTEVEKVLEDVLGEEHRNGKLNVKKTAKATLIASFKNKEFTLVTVYDFGNWKSGGC